MLDKQSENRQPRRTGIWWIASYPKSGSTWMRCFINAAVTGFPIDINAAFQYATVDLVKHVYQHTAHLPVSDMDTREYVYYRPAALLNYLALCPHRDACFKTHHANVTIDSIPMCPPKLTKGILYILRDPRDICPSMAQHMGLTIDETIAFMANDKSVINDLDGHWHWLCSWNSHVRSWIDGHDEMRFDYVRYEDMLATPVETFQKALDALGLKKITRERLVFALEQTAFDNLQKQEKENGFSEVGQKQDRFFNYGKAGHWQDVLTTKQVRRIEENHGDVMRRFGYKPVELEGESDGNGNSVVESCCESSC